MAESASSRRRNRLRQALLGLRWQMQQTQVRGEYQTTIDALGLAAAMLAADNRPRKRVVLDLDQARKAVSQE